MMNKSEWKTKETQRQIAAETNRCVHFTGIQHDECAAGINYRQLIGGPDYGGAKHLPCLKDDESPATCPKAAYPSESEARAEVERRDAVIAEFLTQLSNGICPQCKVEVKQRQIGPCVYGTCGHRLYQGKVNPTYAEDVGAG